jgi:hypothetical protein
MVKQRKLVVKKIYFPGLISLCFVPLLCIWYFFHIGKFEKLTKLTVVWANDTLLRDLSKYSTRRFDVNTFRKFENDSLTGEYFTTDWFLKEFENKIRYFVKTHDTTNSYRVFFGAHAKYEDVVSLIDIAERPENRGLNFIWYKNSFSIYIAEPVAFKPIKPLPL